MMRGNVVVTMVLLALVLGPLAPTARADAGEELSVHLLTIGPKDHPFFNLGQSVVWIQDERAGGGVVYDFGAIKPDSCWSFLVWASGRPPKHASPLPLC